MLVFSPYKRAEQLVSSFIYHMELLQQQSFLQRLQLGLL